MEKEGDKGYVRVTTIVYPFSGLDKIDSEVLANAARRGTKVHKICEGIISGLGELDVDDETRGYVESFKHWWALNPKVVEMEKRFFCDKLKITGQVDMIIKIDTGLAIVDIKTSSTKSDTWKFQGNAYAYLARISGYDIKKIFFIHLNKNGKKPKIYEYDYDSGFFFSVYRTWKYFYGKDHMKEEKEEKKEDPKVIRLIEYGDDLREYERKELEKFKEQYLKYGLNNV